MSVHPCPHPISVHRPHIGPRKRPHSLKIDFLRIQGERLFILYPNLSRRNNSNGNNEINIDIIKIIYLWKCKIVDFLKWDEIGLHLQLDYLASEGIHSNTVHVHFYAHPPLPTFAVTLSAPPRDFNFRQNHIFMTYWLEIILIIKYHKIFHKIPAWNADFDGFLAFLEFGIFRSRSF